MRKYQLPNEAYAKGAEPHASPLSSMEICAAIKGGNLSLGELRFLHRVIEKKMFVRSYRLDLEDLDLNPYYRAF
jgi:hypothetical protein